MINGLEPLFEGEKQVTGGLESHLEGTGVRVDIETGNPGLDLEPSVCMCLGGGGREREKQKERDS
jgi:hypothetical protein